MKLFGREAVKESETVAKTAAERLLREQAERQLEKASIEAENKAAEFFLILEEDGVCFTRTTPVACSNGLKPIGEVVPGDKVKAFDFATGKWVATEVLKRHDNLYTGAIVKIYAGDSAIEATLNHPFWVVKGEELDRRRIPEKLSPGEDEGCSLCGRWALSQDFQAGDLVFGVDGKYRQIVRTEQRYETQLPVANLTIRDHHSFAVGDDMVLVHNVSWCGILTTAKRGYDRLKSLQAAAKANKVQIHAHHIVQKTISKFFPIMGSYIARSQAILKKVGIDVLWDTKNLTWALKWDHSVEYAKAVAETLETAYKVGLKAGGEEGAKEAVEEALGKIEKILNRGEKFRGLP